MDTAIRGVIHSTTTAVPGRDSSIRQQTEKMVRLNIQAPNYLLKSYGCFSSRPKQIYFSPWLQGTPRALFNGWSKVERYFILFKYQSSNMTNKKSKYNPSEPCGFPTDSNGTVHSCSVQRCCFHRLHHGTSQQSILDRSRLQPRQSEQTEPDRKSDRKGLVHPGSFQNKTLYNRNIRNINNKLTSNRL